MATDLDEQETSYLIVGAGVFGASAALELKQAKPKARIVLLDQASSPNPASASFDHNKIIRTDYRDLFYMRLALQALEEWRTNPLFNSFYHETGIIFAENVGKGSDFLRNYDLLDQKTDAQLLSIDTATKISPCFKSSSWDGVDAAYYNPHGGWVNANAALQVVIDQAQALGVVFLKRKVERLLLNHGPAGLMHCVGVQTTQDLLHAEHILLCTGAETAWLLAESAPYSPGFQAGDRLVACAAVSCAALVRNNLRGSLKDAPVFANLMPHTSGEAVPITPNGYVKVNREITFTNYQQHDESRQTISRPLARADFWLWSDTLPMELQSEAKKVLLNTYGDIFVPKSERYRLCWDAITPTQDWLVSRHESCDRLYIATGGSFHAWKFLPVLGRRIVAMLDGQLDNESAARWAWTRRIASTTQKACDVYCPNRDIKEVILDDKMRKQSQISSVIGCRLKTPCHQSLTPTIIAVREEA